MTAHCTQVVFVSKFYIQACTRPVSDTVVSGRCCDTNRWCASKHIQMLCYIDFTCTPYMYVHVQLQENLYCFLLSQLQTAPLIKLLVFPTLPWLGDCHHQTRKCVCVSNHTQEGETQQFSQCLWNTHLIVEWYKHALCKQSRGHKLLVVSLSLICLATEYCVMLAVNAIIAKYLWPPLHKYCLLATVVVEQHFSVGWDNVQHEYH